MAFDIGAVPRSELRRITDPNQDRDVFAERLVAAIVDGTHDPDSAHWYDVRVDRTGTKIEVKSTATRIGDDYPADGRFRLWESQIRSLINSRHAGETGTTWVAFVLFDEDGQPRRARRMHAETVLRLVRDRAGWNDSGHEEYDHQHKLPIDSVFADR